MSLPLFGNENYISDTPFWYKFKRRSIFVNFFMSLLLWYSLQDRHDQFCQPQTKIIAFQKGIPFTFVKADNISFFPIPSKHHP